MRSRFAIVLLVAMSVSADVIDDLLRLPPPPPGEHTKLRERLDKAPADDAPIAEIISYWSHPSKYSEQPSAVVRERLVEAIPKSVEFIYKHLPPRPDVCERVKRLPTSDNVKAWVLLNCASERDALVAVAAKAADDAGGGYVSGGEELEALVRNDWKRAEPIVQQLAGSSLPRTRTLAQSMLYEHAPSESLRTALQLTVMDRGAPGYARNLALETLGRSEWEGRDAWLLERMSDPTLFSMHDGIYLHEPFSEIVRADPERWIPIMTRLLETTDIHVRSAAAVALGEFHLDRARADALRPLMPWISDPAWANDSTLTRLRLIQSVARLELREAIPHLVRAVASDPVDSHRAYAADALADFGDRSGNAAMRDALDTIRSGHDRTLVAAAMIRTDALSAAEMANGVEAALSTNKQLFEIAYDSTRPSSATIIGFVVLREVDDREDVAVLMLARAQELETTKPELARKLIAVIETWAVATADKLLLHRIEQQHADAQSIFTAVQRRADLRVTSSDGLRRLRTMSGVRAGIAAVLIGDAMDLQRILAGDDLEAQRGLLAAARLVRDPLPIEAVAALFGRSPALDATAEAWLTADDRPAARAIVQKRHPNEILILGHTNGAFVEWEQELLRRFRASKDDEWIVLGRTGHWIPMQTVIEIRARGDKATLSREKLGALRLFLDNNRIDDLGPFDAGVSDGAEYEYIHLTRTSGRRVFMNNPDAIGSPHAQLVEMLHDLAENGVR